MEVELKKKFKNSVHVAGYVFSHTLKERTSQKGVVYIGGTLNVATDEAGLNVVPVNFIYVTPTFKSGKENRTYAVLNQIMESGVTFEQAGTEATKVRIDGEISVNDFVNGNGELVAAKQVRGAFVHLVNAIADPEDKRAIFDVEFLCSKCREVEEDDETSLQLDGYVFNFRNELQPTTLTVHSPDGVGYFQDFDISSSNPYLGEVWGSIKSSVVERESVRESAFGKPEVKMSSFSRRYWDIDGASVEPMEFDDESTITKKELKKALEDREKMLADVRQRHENSTPSAFSKTSKPQKAASVDDDDFEF